MRLDHRSYPSIEALQRWCSEKFLILFYENMGRKLTLAATTLGQSNTTGAKIVVRRLVRNHLKIPTRIAGTVFVKVPKSLPDVLH